MYLQTTRTESPVQLCRPPSAFKAAILILPGALSALDFWMTSRAVHEGKKAQTGLPRGKNPLNLPDPRHPKTLDLDLSPRDPGLRNPEAFMWAHLLRHVVYAGNHSVYST